MPGVTEHGFAQREMNRCGWSQGKGLGKTESGMKEAIKVKLKNNTGGLGHDEGTQFTFHWWDHIFNKAANSFKVSEGDDGTALIEKCEGKKITPVLISNKKPLSSKYANADLMYGTFVKAGTYHADKDLAEKTKKDDDDGVIMIDNNDSSDDSSDDEDGSLTVNDTLERTFKKTGLTGHKAARHGFNLCGKLARLENQEQTQLPASESKTQVNDVKNDRKRKVDSSDDEGESSDDITEKNKIKESPELVNNNENDNKEKKKKKKKKKSNDSEIEEESPKIKKSKKKTSEENIVGSKIDKEDLTVLSENDTPKKKKKKKKKSKDIDNEETTKTELTKVSNKNDKLDEPEQIEEPIKKKKKKKKKSVEE